MTGQAQAAQDHEIVLVEFSAYTMDGPNTGCVANPENVWHFPAEGICAGCGGVIRAESYGKPWQHTGRMPGDPR